MRSRGKRAGGVLAGHTPAAFRPARGGGGDGGLARQPARQLCDGTGGERRRRHRPRPALGKGTGTMTVTKVTARLAEWITGLDAAAIPAEVRAEGVRTFVNWVGCAVGGATHETADRALAAVEPFPGPRKATVLGRPEKLDALHTPAEQPPELQSLI